MNAVGQYCQVSLLLFAVSIPSIQTGEAGDGLQRAIALSQQRAYPRALETAAAIESPLGRAQAKLYVLHNAGDLAGALTAGLEGLRVAPSDRWLLERVCYIAISLRATEIAKEHFDRLATTLELSGMAADEQAHWRGLLTEYGAQVDSLVSNARDRSAAVARARVTVFSVLAVSSAFLMLLARQSSKRARRHCTRSLTHRSHNHPGDP